MAFLTAWTNTSKKQNVYDQLMRLTMNRWDIDTYIATFDRLALAAEWDVDSEGTIAKFREGLSKAYTARPWIMTTSLEPLTSGRRLQGQKYNVQRRSTTRGSPEISAETLQNLIPIRTPKHHEIRQIQTIPASFRWKLITPRHRPISKNFCPRSKHS